MVLGSGLAELACALHLRSAGRDVTVLEPRSSPGGRQHSLEIDGFRFDTGPVTPVGAESVAAVFQVAGERHGDWIDLMPVDPICRAHYPDGTTLDVHRDPHRTAENVRKLCGRREALAYQRFLRYARSPVPPGIFFQDPRTSRLFGCEALFGFSPVKAGWWPGGGPHALAKALAAVAEKQGISIRYRTRATDWQTRGRRVVAVRTDDGERLAADAVVVPGPADATGPSSLVLHLGTSIAYSQLAHHNVHFGQTWRRARNQVLVRGELMTDPTILVTCPTRTDPALAPTDRHTHQVVVPVPNLRRAPLPWRGPAARAYAGEIMATLEARGYLDLGAGVQVSYVVTPADWARPDMNYGVPDTPLANVVGTGPRLTDGARTARRVTRIA